MILSGEPLHLGHRALLSPLIAALGVQLSEYSFANLFLFRQIHGYRVVAEPVVHILGTTYDGRRHAMPLAPLSVLDRDTIGSLLRQADMLYPIAERDRAAAERLDLAASAEDADADYVYAADRLAALRGGALKRKRSQANAFQAAEHPVALPLGPETEAAALAILDGWLADVGRGPATTDYAACREALKHCAALELEGLVILSQHGTPLGFLMAGDLADGSKAVHFAKGRRAHAGVYPWMFARFAALSGTARLNFEQDLGKPGFAQAKRAFDPIARLAKYRLTRSEGA